MAVNDIHAVALVQQYEDYKPVNVFHYIETVEGPGGDANTQLNVAFDTTVVGTWAAAVSASLQLLCLIAKTIHPLPSVPDVRSPLSSIVGVKAGSTMPGQTQAVVRKYPAAGVAPFLVGHFNTVGTTENDWQEGQMELALSTQLGATAVALQTSLVAGGYTFQPVIWSPTRKKLITPPFHVVWSRSLVNFGVKVLRRRRGFYHNFA